MFKSRIQQILFYLTFITSMLLGFSLPAMADTNVSGTITTPTTWNLAGSPYIVIGNVTVNSGVTLTIEAGVQVKFDGNYNLTINGTLNAQGAPGNMIRFTSNKASPAPGDWQYIFLNTNSAPNASVVNYAIVEYSTRGVYIPSGSTALHPTIQNSLIQNNQIGVYFEPRSGPNILHNTIINNTDGIFAYCNSSTGCTPTINNNSIYNNSQYNLHAFGDGVATTINAINNWWGSVDVAQVQAKIWYYAFDPTLPRVNFLPFLDGPDGNSYNSPPPSPRLLSITGNINGVNLTWSSAQTATGYKIHYGSEPGIYTESITVGNLLNYSVTGLTVGTTYYFTVSGLNAYGEGPVSNELNGIVGNNVSGTISSNTTWTFAGSPYYVVGNVGVSQGATLTIEPGVQVRFVGNYQISIGGVLNAQGLESNRILFTSNKLNPAPGDWNRIELASNNNNSIISYADIQYASVGAKISNSSPTLTNNRFTNNLRSITVDYWTGATSPILRNNSYSNNLANGILLISQSGNGSSVLMTKDEIYYEINNSIGINGTLTIEPGTEIRFSPGTNLGFAQNSSTANIVGTPSQPIKFTSLVQPGTPGSWQGLRIGSGGTLDYVIVENAGAGSTEDSAGISLGTTSRTLNIRHSIIQNNLNNGIFIIAASPNISFNTITNNANAGIRVHRNSSASNSLANISGNTITNNLIGIQVSGTPSGYPNPVINFNTIMNNTQYDLGALGAAPSNTTINALYNWWGTTVQADIQSHILDHEDTASLPTVNFIPFLDGPGNPDIPAPQLDSVVPLNHGVDVNWSAAQFATGYKIHYGTSPGVYSNVIDVGNVLTYQIRGLTGGIPYYFVVSAYNQVGSGPNSNEISAIPLNQGTDLTGVISQHTTLTLANSPYIVISDVTVNQGVTLTIQPGVEIKFDGNFQIQINGKLDAQGMANNPIRFTSNQQNPTVGYWNRIYFREGSDASSILKYCEVLYAAHGVELSYPGITIDHCNIQQNQIGVYVLASTSAPTITHNTISNNAQYGIALYTNSPAATLNPTINYNSFVGNGLFAVFNGFIGVNHNHSNLIINAQYNWWGTGDLNLIPSKIWDLNDENQRPRVNFDNYLLTDPDHAILITDNNVVPRIFSTLRNETAQINYTLNQGADVTIRIYNQSNTLVRTLVNSQARNAGVNADNWDGKDEAGNVLPVGRYTYTIEAQNASGGLGQYNGFTIDNTNPIITNAVYTPTTNFSPFKGDRLMVQYDLSAPALVWFGYDGCDYAVAQMRGTSGNVEYWNGRNQAGQIYVSGDRPFYVQARTQPLPKNLIGIANDRTSLDVVNLKSNPYLIRPVYNEITQITYELNESAVVTTSIVSPDGAQTLKVLEQDISRGTGIYNLTWDGKTTTGQVVAQAGDYRLRVRAVDSYGVETIRDGNIRVVN